MNSESKTLLDRAVKALRDDVPGAAEVDASAHRSSVALGIENLHAAVAGAIQNCEGVRQLMDAYRAGTLPEAKAMLMKAHLADCGACLRVYRQSAKLDWSAPRITGRAQRRPQTWGWATAAVCVLTVAMAFVYRAYWQVPPGVRAEVVSVDGAAYVSAGGSDRLLAAGAKIGDDELVRTAGDSRAVLRLSDGSLVEVNQRSRFGVEARGRNMTVALNQGAVIVQAAHRTSGHLYVKTPDCRVAVVGTVFSVDAGLKGSRVAVLQGAVHVMHAGVESVLNPGDQLATSDNLAPQPLADQFAWSPEREKYAGLMAQLAVVEHKIAQLPFPEPRYTSDLLARVPAETRLYVSIPNLGEFLSEANAIFNDQLSKSPELQQWWMHGHPENQARLNDIIAKVREVSDYLGDEVVMVGIQDGDRPSGAVLADVQKSGLAEELRKAFASESGGLTVLDPAALADAGASGAHGGYALVRDHEVIFAPTISALKLLNAQLDAGASGFADGNFGKRITAAYGRGAGIILAANLQAILQQKLSRAPNGQAGQNALDNSGLAGVQYLVAEHREHNGQPQNNLNVQFSGTRQRVASWLGSPAPIGSLDFVTPNASLALATLTKEPAAIADDLMAMAAQKQGGTTGWNQIDEKLQISVRDDLAANLGGDFMMALDGPVLPTPAWKLVVEVNSADRLESALERMVAAIRNQPQGTNAHQVEIVSSTDGGRQYYTIHDTTAGTDVAQYTYVDGFMAIAPNRAVLANALQAHASGNSLARSAAFRSQLPKDANENYSAVAYQNLSPVLTPLLSQFSGQSAEAIRNLAADAKPTVICAWGHDNSIEAASDSRLFGFDFLTLGALLDSRNKMAQMRVNR
jgi:hypothetical protein